MPYFVGVCPPFGEFYAEQKEISKVADPDYRSAVTVQGRGEEQVDVKQALPQGRVTASDPETESDLQRKPSKTGGMVRSGGSSD